MVRNRGVWPRSLHNRRLNEAKDRTSNEKKKAKMKKKKN